MASRLDGLTFTCASEAALWRRENSAISGSVL
jgi:hypothetical protein